MNFAHSVDNGAELWRQRRWTKKNCEAWDDFGRDAETVRAVQVDTKLGGLSCLFGRPRRSEQVGETPVLGDSAPVPHLGSCTCSSLTSEPVNAIGAVCPCRPCRQRWPVLSTKLPVDGATGPT